MKNKGKTREMDFLEIIRNKITSLKYEKKCGKAKVLLQKEIEEKKSGFVLGWNVKGCKVNFAIHI